MKIGWMLLGAGALIVLIAIVGYVALVSGWIPANADARPSAFEHWAANTALDATVAHAALPAHNPLLVTDQNLDAGIKLYAANCIVCHSASDGKSSNIAYGLYQHPPRLGKFGLEHDPGGEIYWKIDHGIRLTGMPAFGKSLTDTQIWQIAMFLKDVHKLPPQPLARWNKVPSQAGSALQEPDFNGPPGKPAGP